jgi:hypothetical protein
MDVFTAVIMRETGLELVLSMEISTLVENAVFLRKLCSTLLLRTVQSFGNCDS